MTIGRTRAGEKPSELGVLIRRRRMEFDIGVREFARMIRRSPGFVSQLELESTIPNVSEETLEAVCTELELDPDTVFSVARRLPRSLVPSSALEMALLRRIKKMSPTDQQRLLDAFELTDGKPPRF